MVHPNSFSALRRLHLRVNSTLPRHVLGVRPIADFGDSGCLWESGGVSIGCTSWLARSGAAL